VNYEKNKKGFLFYKTPCEKVNASVIYDSGIDNISV